MGDWVLSQVQPYPGVCSLKSQPLKLPRILQVHASQLYIFKRLAEEVVHRCGSYEDSRLRKLSYPDGRTWYEYDSPSNIGIFIIVQVSD